MDGRKILAGVVGFVWIAALAGAAGEIYVVATSHLDTQWRWTIQDTIKDYIPATLRDNFALFDKYPDYVFSFEGAFRYMLMKEYYPAEYERMKGYIAEGRWRVAGSWVDAADSNVPSPESLVRQVLYGNGFFKQEFGTESLDIFLPDSFGFGFALPSVAAHCGLKGFSSQKLTWGSSVGIPFAVGMWEGVDGSALVAALDPDEYVGKIQGDLSADPRWMEKVACQENESGLAIGYKYFGTGDQGGAPADESVMWLEESLRGRGPLKVLATGSDQLARDLTEAERAKLPRYRGELLMTRHGVGCYTSQAAMKRWNRKNEVLADAAERASVAAWLLGATPYPGDTMREAWVRFLWHQFHDDLTGTSIPQAYNFSWNDELISQDQFASALTGAVGAVSRALDTRADKYGHPIVVFNPLSIERDDIVDAEIGVGAGSDRAVKNFSVIGPDGAEVPAQARLGRIGGWVHVTFPARVPPVGFAVYEVRFYTAPDRPKPETGLAMTADTIENDRYKVRVSGGDIVSIVDKRAAREILEAPLSLQLLDDKPRNWPAWEIDYDNIMASPRTAAPPGLAAPDTSEKGPARVSLVFKGRRVDGSTIETRVSLAAGEAGDRVEVTHDIDWRTPGTLLKAAFPLAVKNEKATYDLGLGTVERGSNRKELYEVPAQRWADVTDADGSYGVAILNDSRYGWDKPDDHTLRLSLVHTPAVNERWQWVGDQASQDLGRHRVTYAVVGHTGDWRGDVPWQADRLNQPLLGFTVPKHPGVLGKTFSLVSVEQPGTGPGRSPAAPTVAVRALKMAEEGNEIVIRLQELAGRPAAGVTVRFAWPIVSAREYTGAEEALGGVAVTDGVLRLDFAPYRPRTLAVRLGEPPARLPALAATPLDLAYDVDGISSNEARSDGNFDGLGNTLASELLPRTLVRGGIPFRTGPRDSGAANVLTCQGQRIELPPGNHDHVYVLAAAVGGGRDTRFAAWDAPVRVWLPDYAEPFGQWDSRLVRGALVTDPAAIKPAAIVGTAWPGDGPRIGWVGTHRHGPKGEDQPYVLTHVYMLGFSVRRGAPELWLPEDPDIRILAITVADNPNDVAAPCQPLYDQTEYSSVDIVAPRNMFTDSIDVELRSPNRFPDIRYMLDGSEPTEASEPYTGRITLKETATLTARAFSPGLDPAYAAHARFTKVAPRLPVDVASPHPGLKCRMYEGVWEKLPDFSTVSPVREKIVAGVAVPEESRREDIGLVIEGFIKVPLRGVYTLHLWSDDGSALYLGGERVIDNDGRHNREEKKADLPLEAGMHAIRVEYFHRIAPPDVELWWEGPGVLLAPVPVEALFHAK